MAFERAVIYPKKELMDVQKKQIRLAETALDALLELNGYTSVVLRCTADQRVRKELEDIYSKVGWRVSFARVLDSDYFYIDIQP